MSAAESALEARVSQWIQYADEDLRLARHALTLSSACPFRLVAYHAQQCAEKYLKAFLVRNRVDFPYTHNIARLLELRAPVKTWTDTLSDAEVLTVYALATRYPAGDEEATRAEALRAIETAAKVAEAVGLALAEDTGSDLRHP